MMYNPRVGEAAARGVSMLLQRAPVPVHRVDTPAAAQQVGQCRDEGTPPESNRLHHRQSDQFARQQAPDKITMREVLLTVSLIDQFA